MDLKIFNQLIVDDANSAKNLLTYMMGFIKSDLDSQTAIIELYKSFDPKFLQEEKIFSQAFYKLFTKFGINENNINYFNQFKKHYSTPAIEEIKRKNKDWKWDRTEYKNAFVFFKSFQSYERDGIRVIEKFLNESEEEIEKLITKDKSKFIENMIRFRFVENIIKNDYIILKDFCTKYSIDIEDLIEEVYPPYKRFSLDFFRKNNNTDQFLMDMLNKPNKDFLNSRNFFQPKSGDEFSISSVFLIFLLNKNIEIAQFLFKNYENEIQKDLQHKISIYRKLNLEETRPWETLLIVISSTKTNHNESIGYYHGKGNNYSDYTDCANEIITTLKMIKLNINLDNLPVNNSKINKVKI